MSEKYGKIKLTRRIEQAIEKYGKDTCLEALKRHEEGSGGSTVGIELTDEEGYATTIWGDRLIDAGRYIKKQL